MLTVLLSMLRNEIRCDELTVAGVFCEPLPLNFNSLNVLPIGLSTSNSGKCLCNQ